MPLAYMPGSSSGVVFGLPNLPPAFILPYFPAASELAGPASWPACRWPAGGSAPGGLRLFRLGSSSAWLVFRLAVAASCTAAFSAFWLGLPCHLTAAACLLRGLFLPALEARGLLPPRLRALDARRATLRRLCPWLDDRAVLRVTLAEAPAPPALAPALAPALIPP